MVVKVYISGISGNKEVKKRQQRVLMILDSKHIKYDVIDITEPGKEDDKDFMQNNATSNGGTVSDPNPRSPLPPQLFADDEYCGDYDQFDMANETDTLEQFLKIEVPPEEPVENDKFQENVLNGDVKEKDSSKAGSKASSQEREPTNGDNIDEAKKTPSREATPADRASKEKSPAEDEEATDEKGDAPSKEVTPEKDAERQKSSERETTPSGKETDVDSRKSSKENSPEADGSVNENGAASSREHSEEKDVADSMKNPSESLIESEQAVSNE